MSSLVQILGVILTLAWWTIIIQAVMSWLISFNVLNIKQPFIYQVWSSLNAVTEPVYRRVRKFLPQTGGLDFAPIVVLLGIMAIRILLSNNLAY
ncbi:YggT family protein [Paracoccaceae bacterium]|nr:YggT family protein [Paracoccaceae bacterium]